MNALGTPLGSAGGVQREQTMEEILASIRKIIESNEAINNPMDDDSQLDNDVAEFVSQNQVQKIEFEPVFEARPVAAPVMQPVTIEAQNYSPPEIIPAVLQPVETPVASLQAEMARLVSQSPERRVAAAFDDLNSAFVKAKQMPLENVAEAMLRPMMKDWLDNNLPNLVERLVREEISRIARGDI